MHPATPRAPPPGAPGTRARLERRDVELPRHENHTFHTDSLRAVQFGTPDVRAEWNVAGRGRPDEHAIGVAAVLGDIGLQPLDHGRDVPAPVVPALARVTLHRHADHAVLRGPSADIVVKGVRLAILDLDLVARAAWDIDKDRPGIRAFLRAEDVDDILRCFSE